MSEWYDWTSNRLHGESRDRTQLCRSRDGSLNTRPTRRYRDGNTAEFSWSVKSKCHPLSPQYAYRQGLSRGVGHPLSPQYAYRQGLSRGVGHPLSPQYAYRQGLSLGVGHPLSPQYAYRQGLSLGVGHPLSPQYAYRQGLSRGVGISQDDVPRHGQHGGLLIAAAGLLRLASRSLSSLQAWGGNKAVGCDGGRGGDPWP